MQLKVRIYSTSKTPWFSSDFADIKKAVAQSKGGGISKIEYVYFEPPKKIPTKKYPDGDIKPDQEWFKDTFTKNATDYDVVAFHCTEKERDQWGISNIGGTYHNDSDEVMEFWFCANKGQKAKHYKGKTEFWRRFLHELSHGHERFLYGKQVQFTHHYDYDLHALPDVYKLYDWTHWDAQKALKESLLLRLADMAFDPPVLPLAHQFWKHVTQQFGAPSPLYKATQTHIGTDFGCPVGTPGYAPYSGEMTEVGTGTQVGNYGIFLAKGKYYRFCHLSIRPEKRKFKKGEVMFFTGNTGLSTGPHLHLEVWKQAVNLTLLTSRASVFMYLEDPLLVLK